MAANSGGKRSADHDQANAAGKRKAQSAGWRGVPGRFPVSKHTAETERFGNNWRCRMAEVLVGL